MCPQKLIRTHIINHINYFSEADGEEVFGEGGADSEASTSAGSTAAPDGDGGASGGGGAALAVSLQRRLTEMQGVLAAKTAELTQAMERLGVERDRVESLEGEINEITARADS